VFSSVGALLVKKSLLFSSLFSLYFVLPARTLPQASAAGTQKPMSFSTKKVGFYFS
jgi:hypothetical protein